jgi:transposase
MAKRAGQNNGRRYSEAFKMTVVREIEEHDLPVDQVRRKYGILGQSVVNGWLLKYGNGSRRMRIRVEKPEEINEKKELKKRIQQLERLLADANIEIALEKAYAKMALERAGIEDVEGFKKKADAKRFGKP